MICLQSSFLSLFFFFFNDTATTEIYTLSLHDALPISDVDHLRRRVGAPAEFEDRHRRSEEHTSELQSLAYLVCRLLLEKKKHKLFLTESALKKQISTRHTKHHLTQ